MGRKSRQQERETDAYAASTVRKQRGMDAHVELASSLNQNKKNSQRVQTQACMGKVITV